MGICCSTDKHTWPLASNGPHLDGRDVGIVFCTVFKQNVLESLEVTKVVL